MAFIDPDEVKPTSTTKGGFVDPDEVKTTPVEAKSTATKQPYLKADGTIDPSWKRPDGSLKGPGWLGIVKSASGKNMSEYSVGLEINGKEMDVPTFVPGLTLKEIEILKSEPKNIPESIIKKAQAHAEQMIKEGKPVFKDWDDKQTPVENKAAFGVYPSLVWNQVKLLLL